MKLGTIDEVISGEAKCSLLRGDWGELFGGKKT
jgi:hypothetical protein